MLGFTESVGPRVVRGSTDLVDVQALADGCNHTKELFSPVGENNFWNAVNMDPVVTQNGYDFSSKFGFQGKERHPPGAQVDNSEHVLEAL